MKNTQAKKLERILKYGILMSVPKKQQFTEIAEQRSEPGGAFLYSVKEEVARINDNLNQGRTLYKFIPLEEHKEKLGFESICQWSKNPFTIVNLIFGMCNELDN